jgi:hypothetical protein
LIFQNLKPSQEYTLEVERLFTDMGLAKAKDEGKTVVAVHLRKMEQMCYKYVKANYDSLYYENLRNMCNITVDVVSEVVDFLDLDISSSEIFVATDGQDVNRDASFAAVGARFVNWSNVDTHHFFAPALDFMLLQKADVFIGNPTSSFSSLVSLFRVHNSNVNREFLYWPIVYPDLSVDSFFKCARFEFWCDHPHLPC